MMDKRLILAVFMIAFGGMYGLITVDYQCREYTGEGGHMGVSVTRSSEGNPCVCFFGIEHEFDL